MRLALIPISILATLTLIWLAKPVLVPVLFALLLAQALSPLVRKFEKRLPQMLSIILAMGLLGMVLTGLFLIVGSQVSKLQDNLPEIIGHLNATMTSSVKTMGGYFGLARANQAVLVNKSFENILGPSSLMALSAVTFTVSSLAQSLLVVILSFLMLRYRRALTSQIKRLGEKSRAATIGRALDHTVAMGQSYVSGLMLVMLIVGVGDTIGFFLIDVPFAALFGCMGGLSVLIPYVGIAIVGPFSIVLTFLLTGSTHLAMGVLGVYAFVHFIEGYVLSPYIVGAKVSLNPLATILAILIGESLWGPAGMILFIPLMGLLKLGFESSPSTLAAARILGPLEVKPVPRKFLFRRKKTDSEVVQPLSQPATP